MATITIIKTKLSSDYLIYIIQDLKTKLDIWIDRNDFENILLEKPEISIAIATAYLEKKSKGFEIEKEKLQELISHLKNKSEGEVKND